MVSHARRPPRHRRLATLALTLATTLVALPAAAQQDESYRSVTAKELFDGIMDGSLAAWVEDPDQRQALSTAMATTYIFGAADSAKGKQWCPARETGIQDLTGVVLHYLDELPEARQSETAALVVAEALGKAHPCER